MISFNCENQNVGNVKVPRTAGCPALFAVGSRAFYRVVYLNSILAGLTQIIMLYWKLLHLQNGVYIKNHGLHRDCNHVDSFWGDIEPAVNSGNYIENIHILFFGVFFLWRSTSKAWLKYSLTWLKYWSRPRNAWPRLSLDIAPVSIQI